MKRITAIMLSFLLILSSAPAFARSHDSYKNGDVNMDGRLSIKDATIIQMYRIEIYPLSAEQLILADVDLDGEVDINDVTKIQKVLAELEEMPYEEPTVPTTEPTAPTTEEPTEAATESTTPTTEEPTEAPTAPTTAEPTEATTESTEPTTAEPTEAPTTQPTTPAPTTQPPTPAPTTAPTEATAPNPEVKNMIDIYFTAPSSWSSVYFFLYNSETGDGPAQWPGTRITKYTTNNFGEKVYSSTVDVDKYNRIIFTNGTQQTVNIPVNKASSGFFISDSRNSKAMLVGTYAATGTDSGKITKTNLTYSPGYNKKIWIWTPADYSATSAEKYRTIYIMDGQNLFDDDHQDGYGGWEVTDAVESMMANGGRGVIIVGIDNGNNKRDSELTPDIGSVVPSYANEFANRTGEAFSNFVVNTVMPYVQKNYNSSTARVDNFIAGSSSGGLEAFYIGLEHKDKFGGIGALSPAFLLFNSSVWNSYLSKYDFKSADMPRLYIYNGNGDFENELYPDVIAMHKRLLSLGYSTDKIKLSIEDDAAHNEAWWRIIFPEFLSWGLQI
ncbi:MAG: starch-binding protein [Ruminococcus sp.]|nr:starch-binding protein [Ruminococcus sp.]